MPITGRENSTIEEKIFGHTIDHHWKMDAGISHGHGVLSKDGETLNYTNVGKGFDGKPIHDSYLVEKK